jgi:hypothetical protein
MLVARPYYAALTNRRFLLLKGSRWALVSRPRDPEFSTDADSVRIEEPRKFLIRAVTAVRGMVFDEFRLAVHRQYWRELTYMRSLLDSGRAG